VFVYSLLTKYVLRNVHEKSANALHFKCKLDDLEGVE
jgi:hypothetical protein